MPPKNSLASTIHRTFEALLSEMNTCIPGVIVSYDYKTRKASVKPQIQKKFRDGSPSLALPVIVNVPVVFPGSSKVGIHFPLKKDDSVLIVFSQRSIDKWLSDGLDSDPGDFRKFDLSDAIAIPGLNSFNKANFATNNEDVVITNESEKITIKSNGDIQLGKDSLKKLVNESFLTLFDTHFHSGVTTGGGVSGPPSTPSNPTHVTNKVYAK